MLTMRAAETEASNKEEHEKSGKTNRSRAFNWSYICCSLSEDCVSLALALKAPLPPDDDRARCVKPMHLFRHSTRTRGATSMRAVPVTALPFRFLCLVRFGARRRPSFDARPSDVPVQYLFGSRSPRRPCPFLCRCFLLLLGPCFLSHSSTRAVSSLPTASGSSRRVTGPQAACRANVQGAL